MCTNACLPLVERNLDDYCFYVVNDDMDIFTARSFCNDSYGTDDMLSIYNQEESDYMEELMYVFVLFTSETDFLYLFQDLNIILPRSWNLNSILPCFPPFQLIQLFLSVELIEIAQLSGIL